MSLGKRAVRLQSPHHILWNLFLAVIPVFLSFLIALIYRRVPKMRKAWWLWLPLGLLWFGFLPNACYLVTEWRHYLQYIARTPKVLWLAPHDKWGLLNFLGLSTFYVLYSGVGLLTFSLSIWPLDQILNVSRPFKTVFFFLCGLGVYMGLITRLNTWDIWNRPILVCQTALDSLSRPLLVLLILGFGAAIWLNYWLFEVFIDGLLFRWRQLRRARQQGAPIRPL